MSTMNVRQKAFLDALERDEDDNVTRLIYADWLDDNDMPEEATRMRRWQDSKKWMVEFASLHHAYGKYHDFELEERTGQTKDGYPIDEPVVETKKRYYEEFLSFLEGHIEGEGNFGFDLPYDFKEYSDEMWQHFEIITGLESPTGHYRKEMPPFRCAC